MSIKHLCCTRAITLHIVGPKRLSHTIFTKVKPINTQILHHSHKSAEISVVKPVRSFTLMRIYSQAHKYHILLTFICWQTDLKYRSTISVIITCNGNNRCGAEQRFWSGLQVWSSLWGCVSSHEQRGRRVAIILTAQLWRWISPLLFGLGCCECGRKLTHRCNLNPGCVPRFNLFLVLVKSYLMLSTYYLKRKCNLLLLIVIYWDWIPGSKFGSSSARNILQLIQNLQLHPVPVFPTSS